MSPQKPPKKEDNNYLRNAARLSGAGIQMGLTIYLGNLLGNWLDGKYGTTYWEITLTLAAIFLAMYAMIKQVNTINK